VIAMPTSALAQGNPGFSTGGQSNSGSQNSRPWDQFTLDAKKRVKLTFRNASADAVIEFFMRESGITIVKDPKLTQKLTLMSPSDVSLSDAFAILNAQIGMLNFSMEKSGNMLLIKGRNERDQNSGGTTMEQIMAAMGAAGNREASILRVYRIKFANASSVAQIVNDVFLQREQQNNPFQMMFGGGNNRGVR
jgi:general secretion pathway protein D